MKILNRIITFVTTVFVIIACIVFAATAICKIGNIEPIKKFHMIKSKPEISLLLKQVKIQW